MLLKSGKIWVTVVRTGILSSDRTSQYCSFTDYNWNIRFLLEPTTPEMFNSSASFNVTALPANSLKTTLFRSGIASITGTAQDRRSPDSTTNPEVIPLPINESVDVGTKQSEGILYDSNKF
jgi:hypothetical protein